MATVAEPRLHMMKLAVGCDAADDLAARQTAVLAREGRLAHRTRQCPRRQEELLSGGSLYWVIRGQLLLRQRLLEIEEVPASLSETRRTLLLLDPQLIRTEAKAQRPFQGWRYLRPEAAPLDLGPFAPGQGEGPLKDERDAMPAAMRAELRALGLL